MRNYGSAVPATTLASSASNVASTITVTSSSSFPSTPFVAILDRDTASEEVVLVTNVAGATWTVTCEHDGTAGCPIWRRPPLSMGCLAIEFREANTHVNATTGVHGVSGAIASVSYVDAVDVLKAPLASPRSPAPWWCRLPAVGGEATTKTYVDTADAPQGEPRQPHIHWHCDSADRVGTWFPTTKAQMDAADALKAPLASPTFTGTVTVPTLVLVPMRQRRRMWIQRMP